MNVITSIVFTFCKRSKGDTGNKARRGSQERFCISQELIIARTIVLGTICRALTRIHSSRCIPRPPPLRIRQHGTRFIYNKISPLDHIAIAKIIFTFFFLSPRHLFLSLRNRSHNLRVPVSHDIPTICCSYIMTQAPRHS